MTDGVEIAEARKLAGKVSAESEVTPRRSFSLNILLHDGERVKVLVPSWRDNEIQQVPDGSDETTRWRLLARHNNVNHSTLNLLRRTSSGLLSVPMEIRALYSFSRSCLACKRRSLKVLSTTTYRVATRAPR